MTKTNPGRQPNKDLVTKSVGAVNPPTQDHGKGATAPAKSNNDVSYSPAPK
jgi:hypothetical protein